MKNQCYNSLKGFKGNKGAQGFSGSKGDAVSLT